MIPVAVLVRKICASTALPVIASGGIMDGRDVTKAMALGAAAVQLGTAFLPCPESGAPPAYKRALLEAKADTTVITRAFSGRPARGLTNAFIAMVAGKEDLQFCRSASRTISRGRCAMPLASKGSPISSRCGPGRGRRVRAPCRQPILLQPW